MALPGKINRQPQGLLGFLGIKNFGRNPDELGSVLVPTWDLSELYYGSFLQTRTNAIALAGIGSQAFLTVPGGEVWWVQCASAATGTLGAGQSLQLCIQVTDQAGTGTVALTDPANLATVGQRAVAALNRPIVLSPGDALGAVATVFAAGPITVTYVARVAVLPT